MLRQSKQEDNDPQNVKNSYQDNQMMIDRNSNNLIKQNNTFFQNKIYYQNPIQSNSNIQNDQQISILNSEIDKNQKNIESHDINDQNNLLFQPYKQLQKQQQKRKYKKKNQVEINKQLYNETQLNNKIASNIQKIQVPSQYKNKQQLQFNPKFQEFKQLQSNCQNYSQFKEKQKQSILRANIFLPVSNREKKKEIYQEPLSSQPPPQILDKNFPFETKNVIKGVLSKFQPEMMIIIHGFMTQLQNQSKNMDIEKEDGQNMNKNKVNLENVLQPILKKIKVENSDYPENYVQNLNEDGSNQQQQFVKNKSKHEEENQIVENIQLNKIISDNENEIENENEKEKDIENQNKKENQNLEQDENSADLDISIEYLEDSNKSQSIQDQNNKNDRQNPNNDKNYINDNNFNKSEQNDVKINTFNNINEDKNDDNINNDNNDIEIENIQAEKKLEIFKKKKQKKFWDTRKNIYIRREIYQKLNVYQKILISYDFEKYYSRLYSCINTFDIQALLQPYSHFNQSTLQEIQEAKRLLEGVKAELQIKEERTQEHRQLDQLQSVISIYSDKFNFTLDELAENKNNCLQKFNQEINIINEYNRIIRVHLYRYLTLAYANTTFLTKKIKCQESYNYYSILLCQSKMRDYRNLVTAK
ncbi:hypothetical protein PPERSA_06968 [Pseudocohnilembus persalinus]|uniref:Uncharacterized protein n=1 Tax=Pseudocohnilembus persalinus TaxID=266149 RepID=A0A0V0QYF3_PSEPJ|nr:hypothetical protein PPERSA_06968 [Pseudocohnilembus persalinus]|eukprot:KRX07353.1 hypothetical protein PPERSA_06968 [Pseudocohnilembus persalinus]